jgi:DNA ligase-1
MANDFEVQLANEWPGTAGSIPRRAIIEPKLDGGRCLMVIVKGRYCAWSRNGNTFNNVGHIAAELKNFDGYVLDGELVSTVLGEEGWSRTMSAARRAEEGDASLSYVVFDLLAAKEFDSRKCDRPLIQRQALLKAKMPAKRCFTGIVSSFPVKSPADVERFMKKFVKIGFEGAVLKDLDATYSFRRSSSWLKAKPFSSLDLPVVGLEEGKGRLKGTLGKVLVKGPKGTVSGVGTGFTDEERDRVWKLGRKIIGKIAEVKFQNATKSGSLRFPSFLRWRVDKD